MKETLRCKRCGSDNAASQRFCTNCGTALQAPVAETPPSPGPSQPSSPDVQKQIQAGSEPNQRASRILGIPLGFVPRVINLALRWIPRIPFYSRVAPFLGLNELSGIRPVFTLGALAIAGFLGLYPSRLGHIDTTPFLYPIMALISSFNPALGMVSGVIFGIGDFAEKLITNQVYYSGSANIVDYLGARIGYIISYSAVIFTGMLPGVMSRAFRLAARKLFGNQASPPPGALGFIAFTADSRVMEAAASVVGGLLGGGLASVAAIPLELPAFMLRANPDISCYSLAVGNLTRGITPTAIAGGAGGALVGLTSGGGGGASGPAAPSAPASTPASVPPMVIDQKVVSGDEAIQRLIDEGLHDGDCVPVPDHWASTPSNVRGVGYTKTRPHPTDPNKRCLDPEHIAITVDWPHPPGPTKQTWIEPGGTPKERIEDIENGLGDLGFPSPGRVKTPDGEFVRAPENLPDHVAGVGHGTRTVTDPSTGEKVVVINPEMPIAVEHWPKQPTPSPSPTPPPPSPTPPPPSPTPPPPSPTPPPPSPTPPPPSPTPPPPSPSPPPKTYVFGMRPLVAIEGGEIVVASLMCVKVRGIHGGSGDGYLVYKGVGAGAGTPVSVWGPGFENQVIATQPMTVAQFQGGGAVGGIGAAVGVGLSANSIVFFCGPLPNVYWVPAGFAIGAGGGFSGTAGMWNFHRTAAQALADVTNAISGGVVDKYIGQGKLAGYMSQIQTWILTP